MAVFRETWRHDDAAPEARQLEAYVALSRHTHGFDTSGIGALDAAQGRAVDRLIEATQLLLRTSGVHRLRLFRGQARVTGVGAGDSVVLTGRGLSPWTPDEVIAFAYAAKHRRGIVLSTTAAVETVALAFDPSSDGEVVLIGDVQATVSRLVT